MWLMSLRGHPYVEAFQFSIGQLGIAVQRNMLVRQFLDSKCTHLFFLDDDVAPPMSIDVIRRLADMRRPIATGVYALYLGGKVVPAVYRLREGVNVDLDRPETLEQDIFQPAEPRSDGVERVDGCGGGCLLIERSVLEKTREPWFVFPPFKEDRFRLGEDLYFSLNSRRAGCELWCDWSIKCAHHKTVPLMAEFVMGRIRR